jgi:hypothetical protein
MNRVQLRIGDRIALLRTYSALPAGTQGAITYVYTTEPDLYRVRFDDRFLELPIFVDYLAHLTPMNCDSRIAGTLNAAH